MVVHNFDNIQVDGLIFGWSNIKMSQLIINDGAVTHDYVLDTVVNTVNVPGPITLTKIEVVNTGTGPLYVEGYETGTGNFVVNLEIPVEGAGGEPIPPAEVIRAEKTSPTVFEWATPVPVTNLIFGYNGIQMDKLVINDGEITHGYTIGNVVNSLNIDQPFELRKIEIENAGKTEIYIEGYGAGGLIVNEYQAGKGDFVPIPDPVTDLIIPPPAPVYDANKKELTLWSYPHWYDPENNFFGIDFDITRDVPAGTDSMNFEFLHLYKPTDTDEYQESFNHRGDKVGVHVVVNGNNFLGNKNKGTYTAEYVTQIKQLIPHPFVTVSGLGPFVEYLMSQTEKYQDDTIEFIVDFTKNVCDFDGINCNIERLNNNYMYGDVAPKYVDWLRKLCDRCHSAGIKCNYTTQAEIAYRANAEQTAMEYVIADKDIAFFKNPMLYDIPFDIINYMFIDLFWSQPNKEVGHFTYEGLKMGLDYIKQNDPLFQERTMVQLGNYGVWGYNDGWFNPDGTTARTPEEQLQHYLDWDERGIYAGDAEQAVRTYHYNLFVKNQIEGLLAGNEQVAGIHQWQGAGANDFGWDETAGYTLTGAYRNPINDEVILPLGNGTVNRFRAPVFLDEPTVLIYSDQTTISNKMKWVFENYSIKKFSLWHAAKNTEWFTPEAIAVLTEPAPIPEPEPEPEPIPEPVPEPVPTPQKNLLGGLPAIILGFAVAKLLFQD